MSRMIFPSFSGNTYQTIILQPILSQIILGISFHFSWDATEGLVIVNVRGIFHLYTKRFLHTGLHERWY